MTVWLFDCLTVWLFNCLTVWLFDCLTVWLFNCLTVWLFDCLTVWLFDCLTDWLFDYLTVWLFNCLAVWLLYCLTVTRWKLTEINKTDHLSIFEWCKTQQLTPNKRLENLGFWCRSSSVRWYFRMLISRRCSKRQTYRMYWIDIGNSNCMTLDKSCKYKKWCNCKSSYRFK